jgi:hypothetical protein
VSGAQDHAQSNHHSAMLPIHEPLHEKQQKKQVLLIQPPTIRLTKFILLLVRVMNEQRIDISAKVY